MHRFFFMAAILAFVSVPAMAAQPSCSSAPKSQWQPQSKLETILKNQGLKIVRVKVENGCYEVYATDTGGKRVNLAFNAETLQKLDNPEAGEN
jgi:hypothetical protein